MMNSIRTEMDFNSNWKFLKLTKASGLSELKIERPDFDDSAWESINLPHTWNAVDGADGWSGTDEGGEHYYRGLGGYRKSFALPEGFADKRLYIEFEGANTVAEVYINGCIAGRHEGGYALFRFEITDLVKPDSENIIAVKVNNAPTDYIAPITNQGDFTKMGGIYRNVKLIAVPEAHIDLLDYGSCGVYITPENISGSHADIGMLVKLAGSRFEDVSVRALAEIYDMGGKLIAFSEGVAAISAGGRADYNTSIKLLSPHLWNGVEDPYLYTACVSVLSADGELLDRVSQNFGIRSYSVDYNSGFYLNGRSYDLHGVNYHQDSYENGWAMTDSQHRRDYGMMLNMGCTAIRMAHYQHSMHEYDLCDRLGLCVWTEVGLVNAVSADNDKLTIAAGFANNLKQQLTELIRQNYNHPSIIIWGTSNELYQMSDEIFDLYSELNALARSEDKSRLVSFADAQFWGRFLELPADVIGVNRYFGWYIDGADDAFGKWLDGYHAKQKRAVAITEYGAGGAISQHKDNIVWAEDIDSWGERHPENYQSAMHEDIWRQFCERPYIWGKYIWCMFDFASDGRQEGDTKGLNDKGLCTREREPKDAYYFYKSVWNSKPMLHLTEKRFTERQSPVPIVKAYSNAERVELFVDGVSMGEGTRNGTVFTWKNVRIKQAGASKIRAAAFLADGSLLEDSAEWTGLGQSLLRNHRDSERQG